MRLRLVFTLLWLAACPASSGAPAGAGSAPRPHPQPRPRASTALADLGPFADPRGMRMHLIDVGQGAATLLEFPCAAVLVDTGGEDDEAFHSNPVLTAYLDAFFAARPDLDHTLAAVYLTHQHIDHTRGAQAVFERYKVLNVITNGMNDSSGGAEQEWLQQAALKAGIGYQVVHAADVAPGGTTNRIIDPVACPEVNPGLSVLWGAVDRGDITWIPKAFDNRNNHSVVLRVTLGESSLLITGDLETHGIDALMDKHRRTDALDVDVYQVGHHGSYNGTTKKFLADVTPTLALIACGPPTRELDWTAWKYGHPRKVTIDKLEAAVPAHRRRKSVLISDEPRTFFAHSLTDAIYATGWDGTIVVELGADGAATVWTAAGD